MAIASDLDESVIPDLYKKYLEAVNNNFTDTDQNVMLSRRLLKNDKYYSVHVKKLKDVNGFKTHNLVIKGTTRSNDTVIYINNPVESKIPNSFLTIEEFKRLLIERIDSKKDSYAILHPSPKNFNKKKVTFHRTSSTKTGAKLTLKKSTHKHEKNIKSNLNTKDRHETNKITTQQGKVQEPFISKTTIITKKVTLQPQKSLKSDHKFNVEVKKRNPVLAAFIASVKILPTMTLKPNESSSTVRIKNNRTDTGNLSKPEMQLLERHKKFQPISEIGKLLTNKTDTGSVTRTEINKFKTNDSQSDQKLSKILDKIDSVTSDSVPAIDINIKKVSATKNPSTNSRGVRLELNNKDNNITQFKNIKIDTEKLSETETKLQETHSNFQPISDGVIILTSSIDTTKVIDQTEVNGFRTNDSQTVQNLNKTLHEIDSLSAALDIDDKQISTTFFFSKNAEGVTILKKSKVKKEKPTKTSTNVKIITKPSTKRTRRTYARPRVFFGSH
ncbi:hypothetical protein evm_002336 [Chilo suppressalis]|nr:hypothetical protein evm_002336 [Chilo suppressalis]